MHAMPCDVHVMLMMALCCQTVCVGFRFRIIPAAVVVFRPTVSDSDSESVSVSRSSISTSHLIARSSRLNGFTEPKCSNQKKNKMSFTSVPDLLRYCTMMAIFEAGTPCRDEGWNVIEQLIPIYLQSTMEKFHRQFTCGKDALNRRVLKCTITCCRDRNRN